MHQLAVSMGKKHEHHGGAWKVAYADFVTAMMALFMVLWISAQDEEILIATSQYFQSPFNSPLDRASGVMQGDGNKGARRDTGENSPSNMVDLSMMHSLANEFYRMLNIEESDVQKPIDIKVTSDGLRIIAYDRVSRPLFESGKDAFTDWGTLVTQNLAWLMDRYNMRIRIDAHTAGDFSGSTRDYGQWELSADRSNAVRRALIYYALDEKKINMVSSFADTKPMEGKSKQDSDNQRIELSLTVGNLDDSKE
jgi:chemotaxis protein MotB